MSLENNQELESTDGSESFEQEQSLEQNQDKQLFDELGLDPSKYGLDLEGKRKKFKPPMIKKTLGHRLRKRQFLKLLAR